MLRTLMFVACSSLGVIPAYVHGEALIHGMGEIKWGASREDVVGLQGPPDLMDDVKGSMWYLNKTAMGKQVEVVYNFGDKCTTSVESECRFSDGYYIFYDGSEAYANNLSQMLDEMYGKPVTVTHSKDAETENFVSSGKKELQHTSYVRRVDNVKLVHTHTVSLYDYADFAGEVTPAGSVENRLHYYGPNYAE